MEWISGSGEMTPRIPPSSGSLASMSPKVLETESPPGFTLQGPKIRSSLSSGILSILKKSLWL